MAGVRQLNVGELEPLAAVGGVLGLTDFAKRSAYEVDPNTPPSATQGFRLHRAASIIQFGRTDKSLLNEVILPIGR